LGYAVTPDVKCYNCHFQFFNGYSKPCDIGCSALNSISPLNVIKVVQEILKNEYLPLMVGRREGLSKLNKIVRERFESPNIVEIGTIRKHDNVDGDGYSTFFFGWLNKDLGGKFYTVDIDPESIKISQNICSVLSDNINFHTGDGENFLKKFKEEIDVLYLDGFDSHIEQRDQAQHHAVKEFLAAENKLKENAVVAIDDAVNGKGDLLEGILLTKGFNLLFYSEANNQKIYSRIK
jgi:predicted O-methyltransferase YrrM